MSSPHQRCGSLVQHNPLSSTRCPPRPAHPDGFPARGVNRRRGHDAVLSLGYGCVRRRWALQGPRLLPVRDPLSFFLERQRRSGRSAFLLVHAHTRGRALTGRPHRLLRPAWRWDPSIPGAACLPEPNPHPEGGGQEWGVKGACLAVRSFVRAVHWHTVVIQRASTSALRTQRPDPNYASPAHPQCAARLSPGLPRSSRSSAAS